MRVFLVLAVSIFCFIFPITASAAIKPPTVLTRVGKWEVNYDQDSCHLFRKFGVGADELTVNFTRYTLGDSFDLSLYGIPVKSAEPRPTVELTFGGQGSTKMTALAGTAGGGLPLLLLNSIRLDGSLLSRNFIPPGDHPAISTQDEAAVRSITLKLPRGRYYRLDTGSMAAPMAAMRTCTMDLIKRWGYDPIVQVGLKQPAKPLNAPTKWLTTGDFPREAAMEGASGIVQVRIDLDEKGAIVGCHILHRTSPDQFADLTCKLIVQRAKLSPALDASGTPVRSFYATKIAWLASAF